VSPVTFKDLLGNREAAGRLQQMAALNRVPPSLLFAGPAGVGKLGAALALAQALNCPSSDAGDSCGRCPSCRRIERGEHPDVRVITPEGKGGQLRVSSVRAVVAEIAFRPFEGQKRVFILKDAGRMNLEAANALLKSLEEPPPSSVLILVTAGEAELPPTVLSRCQRVRFRPLLPEERAEILVRDHGLTGPQAIDAASLLEGAGIVDAEGDVEELRRLRHDALRLLEGCARGWSRSELLAEADGRAREAERSTRLLRMTLGLMRDVTACAAGESGHLRHRDLRAELGALAGQASLDVWIEAYRQSEAALSALEHYSNKRLTWENLLLELRALQRLD
jgi:DNA polymerase-3 subunit delta'